MVEIIHYAVFPDCFLSFCSNAFQFPSCLFITWYNFYLCIYFFGAMWDTFHCGAVSEAAASNISILYEPQFQSPMPYLQSRSWESSSRRFKRWATPTHRGDLDVRSFRLALSWVLWIWGPEPEDARLISLSPSVCACVCECACISLWVTLLFK